MPTVREIFLLGGLLVFLLTFPTTYKTPGGSLSDSTRLRSNLYGEETEDVAPVTLESKYSLQSLSAPLVWGMGQVPETDIVVHVPGWTMFDRLYFRNGTFYVVTENKEEIPDLELIISSGIYLTTGTADEAKRLPTDKDMRIIDTDEARGLLGTQAERLDGITWVANDPKQFITHYYHWSAELIFGFWRTHSSLDPNIPPSGETDLPAPRRMLMTRIDAANWRDYAAMNQWVLFNAFPSITMEFMDDWNERANSGHTYVLDRSILADRAAAIHGHIFLRTQRTAGNAFALPGSVNWWQPVRNHVVGAAGLTEDVLQKYGERTPVITYISRQGWGRRMLIQEHHERLVEELYKLRDFHGYEVNVVSMDKLSRAEQMVLAGRTTIMMGVHGNGLTSLLWMRPTPRSTVMEFFYPGGFAHDYEYTTRALGMVHYGFWGDRAFTRPDVPPVAYPEGFQGNEIPIDGELVARICVERLQLSEEADD
ncbi:uncharacterized protein PHACADRAFT_254213 [Phanerochaete carnosa HHB-10118-sp]|uniref:Glycosyltransferase 61 catalytic domain-containing protein n=1 Tax=Phanerochaete carnosa (strain HHB-10118-sp) TaxID=650164 RepID=K5VZ73_PHACS|nr:uncharacterized protein PHACADRAFT_254213 [Phanerochaete carnosa HHB-10118-sp]EKM56858.1 hypothetical protein PHACADRAFT_254213 [Phanerochaete carnosa HHB-10118-sp]